MKNCLYYVIIILTIFSVHFSKAAEYGYPTGGMPVPEMFPVDGQSYGNSSEIYIPTSSFSPAVDSTFPSRRWLTKPVRFDVKALPLRSLLAEFASGQGVSAQVSPALDGEVTGKFVFDDPAEFLDLLSRAQHFNWYFDGGVVHFFGEGDMRSQLISIDAGREDMLRLALCDLGVFDPRFSWRLADGGRLLMVQGPQVYLDRINDVLARQKEADAAGKAALAEEEARTKAQLAELQAEEQARPKDRKLGVFRLKHAWAAERTITTGSMDTVVPGVADMLRQILSGAVTKQMRAPSVSSAAPRFRRGQNVPAQLAEQPPGAEGIQLENVPFIQADNRMNAVLVWDTPDNLARYQEIIDRLDQPLELVEIRAAIIDVETNRSRELGVSWEYKRDGDTWKHDAGSNVGSGDDRITFDSIKGDGFQYATIFTKGLDQFMARVSALAKQGDANILSRPSVLTQDNIQATLEHTETFYVKLEGEREVDLAEVTTGLTLRVTPHVVQEPDGAYAIQLAVYIVNGSDDSNESGRVENLPRVRQSTITTNAVVYEGEALIVGGYYNETRSNSETGVPVLRKIPGLGALFRTRGKQRSKSERLFVLSPRIVRPGESPMLEGSEAERSLNYSPIRKNLEGPAFEEPSSMKSPQKKADKAEREEKARQDKQIERQQKRNKRTQRR